MKVVIAGRYQFFLPELKRVLFRKCVTIPVLPSALDDLNDHVRHTTFTLVSCDNRRGSYSTVTALPGGW